MLRRHKSRVRAGACTMSLRSRTRRATFALKVCALQKARTARLYASQS